MLTRLATIIVLCLPAAVMAAAPAVADGGVTCPPVGMVCYVNADQPSGPDVAHATNPTPRRAAQEPVCRIPVAGDSIDCSSPEFGWWSNADGCYLRRLDPPPPATDPAWAGHYPDGAIYQTTCFGYPGTGGGWVWRAAPPPGYGGSGLAVEALAAEAVAQLPLLGPDIGMAPDPAKTGLVGLPVWMWTRVSPSTWGPVSATASVPGMSVTATAKAVRIVWDMGDGQRVTCTGPGTPYTKDAGATSSPTCGYLYARSSATEPGAAYTVTATTTWDIQWSGGGASGQLTQTRTSSTSVRIGELQVLVS
ncbi:MAG: hypothetical protein ACOYXW_13555 [Actinomycetota bacterium]